jgi:hypothetical protein
VTLAEDITGLTFAYTFENGAAGIPNNLDGTPANDRDKVRGINIILTGRTSIPVRIGTTPEYRTRQVQTYITMRNMAWTPRW